MGAHQGAPHNLRAPGGSSRLTPRDPIDARAGDVTTQRVTTLAELEALAPEWRALWERCPDATPFQAPEWLLPWRRHLGRGALAVLAFRDGARLVGLVPFERRRLYATPLRRLCLLGTGNTDYLDALLDPAALTGCVLALQQWLARDAHWDLCDLQQLRAESPLLHLAPPPGGLRECVRQEVCPVLALPASREEWRSFLTPGRRRRLEYAARRLAREGARFETAATATRAHLLEALFRLHGRRWRRRGLPGVFFSAALRRFHHEVSAAFLERGWLRLHALRCGEVIAALYCFLARGRACYYAGGFAPGHGRLSPGTALTEHAILDAIAAGAGEFDFLRGGEPYKHAWGAVDRPNHRLTLWRTARVATLGRPLLRLECAVARAVQRRLRAAPRGITPRSRSPSSAARSGAPP